MLALDDKFKGNMLYLEDVGDTKRNSALQAATVLKRMVGYLRQLSGKTKKAMSLEVADLKNVLKSKGPELDVVEKLNKLVVAPEDDGLLEMCLENSDRQSRAQIEIGAA